MASITGTGSNDLLIGTAKNDVIDGYQGDDTLLGGAGNDDLFAGAYLSGGNWIPEPPAHNLIMGGAGDDTLGGGSGSDRLYGGPGNDFLYLYLDGPSVLDGQGGNDTLSWEESAIRLNGGRGRDTLFAHSADLDLRNVPDGKLVDIEIIDISVSDGLAENKLTLTKTDILAISSTTDTLKVVGHEYHYAGTDMDVVVDIVGHYRDRGASGGFHHYKVGSATLLVDTDFTVI
jgi:Ca2+-binding RTX toxin-like protein